MGIRLPPRAEPGPLPLSGQACCADRHMSVNFLTRATKPLGRIAKAGGRRQFSTSHSRRRPQGSASTGVNGTAWTGQRVLTVAAVAGMVGWGLASLGNPGFPTRTALLLDSRYRIMPRYASVQEMELVRRAGLDTGPPSSLLLTPQLVGAQGAQTSIGRGGYHLDGS